MARKTASKKILLIDENTETTLKSAISMRWSLLLNFLPDHIDGQDYVIHKRTLTQKKVPSFMHLYYKHSRQRPSFFQEDALIHVQKYNRSDIK